jgi:hypothetical protein
MTNHHDIAPDATGEPMEAPSNEARPLIAAAVGRHPDYGPARLAAHLDGSGYAIPEEQIRGFLAGM